MLILTHLEPAIPFSLFIYIIPDHISSFMQNCDRVSHPDLWVCCPHLWFVHQCKNEWFVKRKGNSVWPVFCRLYLWMGHPAFASLFSTSWWQQWVGRIWDCYEQNSLQFSEIIIMSKHSLIAIKWPKPKYFSGQYIIIGVHDVSHYLPPFLKSKLGACQWTT